MDSDEKYELMRKIQEKTEEIIKKDKVISDININNERINSKNEILLSNEKMFHYEINTLKKNEESLRLDLGAKKAENLTIDSNKDQIIVTFSNILKDIKANNKKISINRFKP